MDITQTHIHACARALENQTDMNKSVGYSPNKHMLTWTLLFLYSWLLEEIAEGTGNPQLNTGSHGVLMSPWLRDEHFIPQSRYQEQSTASQVREVAGALTWGSKGLIGEVYVVAGFALTQHQEKLQSLCYISEAKHQQRQFYTSIAKTRVIVREGGMWLHYNITKIMCVVLWS